jgi:hypothetical protein
VAAAERACEELGRGSLGNAGGSGADVGALRQLVQACDQHIILRMEALVRI